MPFTRGQEVRRSGPQESRFDGRREATRVTGSNGSTNLGCAIGSWIRSSPATPAGVRRTPVRRTAERMVFVLSSCFRVFVVALVLERYADLRELVWGCLTPVAYHFRPLNKTMSLITVARAMARREPSRDQAKSEMIRSVRCVS